MHRRPTWSIIEVGHPLLTQNVDMAGIPNSQYRLHIRGGTPIEVEDAVVIFFPVFETPCELGLGGIPYRQLVVGVVANH